MRLLEPLPPTVTPLTPARLSREALERRLLELELELTSARRQLATLEHLAFTDPLTGLHNRRYLDERLAQELSRAQRQAHGRFGVLALDLDRFKQVNDTLGHASGDAVLRAVGQHLRASLRSHDVVCRTGGDEFVVVLPEAGQVECAVARSRVVRGLPGLAAPGIERVGLAIGWAAWPIDGRTAAELLATADERMYLDKQRHAEEAGAATPPRAQVA